VIALDWLKHIRCFMLDMDGTIYLGDRLLPGAPELFTCLELKGLTYLLVTNNSSKNRGIYVDKLHSLGLTVPEDRIFTSGEATAIYLGKHFPGRRLYVVGTPALEKELHGHGLILSTGDKPDVAVLGFDTTLTYEKLWRLCDLVREGVPYIATHPDFNCPVEGGYMPDIGAMIAFVKASTGREPDVIVGKPYPPIVEAALARTGIPLSQTCMVGDRLYTDIALGAAGIRTILTLSGEARAEEIAGSAQKPDGVITDLSDLVSMLGAM